MKKKRITHQGRKLKQKRRHTPGQILGIVVALLLLIGVAFWKVKPVFAQTVLSEIRDFLVTKAGFTYLQDASADFLYFKETENYTAYAGEKATNGRHRMRLTVDKYIFDYSLLAASLATLGVSTGAAPAPLPTTGDEARDALLRIQALTANIEQHSAEIDAQLLEAQQVTQGVLATAQLIDVPAERMILFENVRQGTDIRHRLNEGGIKQEIILRDPSQRYNQFTFSLDTHGLTPRDIGGGVWYFYAANNQPVFRIPKGWAKDESGAFTNDVAVTVENGFIVLRVNEEWLYANERVFPILIDSSVEVIPELRKTNSAYKKVTPAAEDTGKDMKPVKAPSDTVTATQSADQKVPITPTAPTASISAEPSDVPGSSASGSITEE